LRIFKLFQSNYYLFIPTGLAITIFQKKNKFDKIKNFEKENCQIRHANKAWLSVPVIHFGIVMVNSALIKALLTDANNLFISNLALIFDISEKKVCLPRNIIYLTNIKKQNKKKCGIIKLPRLRMKKVC